MASFDENSEDRLTNEAEELMRQGRYQDAVGLYKELCMLSPSDVMTNLAYASALECAGHVTDAEQIVSETANMHRDNANVHRFQHLFFERREDYNRANLCQETLREHSYIGDGPIDQLADLYFNQGRYHEALKELERIQIEEDIDNDNLMASILGRVGACYRQSQKYTLALEYLERAMEYDQENHWLLTELAETQRALEQKDEARQSYNLALEYSPEDHFARSRLAALEFEVGNKETAIELYQEILTDQPKAHWAMVELAQLLSGSDRDRSRQLCEEALDIDPTFPIAYAQLGQLARIDQDLEAARDHYNEALNSMPNANWILHELADIAHQLNRHEEAQAHLDRARSNDPFDAITYGIQADILRNKQELAEAIPYLRKAVELDDQYAWAWRELAEIYAIQGQHEQADAAFDTYCSLEQNQAYADGLQAFLLRHRKQKDASIPFLERAVREQPDYYWAWRELVEHYLHAESYSLAEEKAQTAIKHVGDHPALWAMLAEALRQQQDYAKAIHAVEQALELDQNIPQLWALRAELLIHSDTDEALRSAKRACELDDAIEYAVLHAQCLLHIGQNPEEAQDIITQLIEQDAQDAFIFDMAAEIAMRLGDRDAALLWTEQGLDIHDDDRRLLLRRALIAVERQEGQAEELLDAAANAPQQQAWREFILPYAQVGNIHGARRYAYVAVEQVRDKEQEQARVWLSLAEAELTARNTEEAKLALFESINCDEQCTPAHLLLGMLAEQDKRYDDAAYHLQTVYDQYAEHGRQGNIDVRSLLRQLAHIEEQRHQEDSAREYLAVLVEHSNGDPISLIDQAAFDLRHGRADEAEACLLSILQDEHASHHAQQRAIQNLAWHYLHSESPETAHDWIQQHLEKLDAAALQLATQLALASGRFEKALEHIDAIPQSARDDAVVRLQCRALIGLQRYDQAVQILEALLEEHPKHEEHAVLLGECLIYRLQYKKALDLLDDEELGLVASDERLFMVACLHLELHGVEHCLTWLGHKPAKMVEDTPLKRVIQEAFKGIWFDRACALPNDQDLLALPPMPRAMQRLAETLQQRHKYAIASQLLALAHSVAKEQNLEDLRRELAAALALQLKMLKQKSIARRYAWESKRLGVILKCLF